MKAYFLTQFGESDRAFELQEVPVPKPGPGEVLIKVAAFGLNYADVMARQGLYRGTPPLPCVIGYDVEGELIEAGTDVHTFTPGEKVFALSRFGGYAEYVVTKASVVGKLSSDAPVGMGCALAVQGVTAYHAAEHVQKLMPGEKVLVHAAAGGLGTCLLQIAKWRKCVTIGVAGGSVKAAYLKSMGVEHVIDHHRVDYIEYVNQHFGGKVDVIFDNIGGKSVQQGRKLLAPGGRLISLGAAALSGKHGKINLIRLAAGFGWFSPIPFLGKSQSFIGVNMLKLADERPDLVAEDFLGVARLIANGVLDPHIGEVFPHTALAEAHSFMENRGAIGKVVMTW